MDKFENDFNKYFENAIRDAIRPQDNVQFEYRVETIDETPKNNRWHDIEVQLSRMLERLEEPGVRVWPITKQHFFEDERCKIMIQYDSLQKEDKVLETYDPCTRIHTVTHVERFHLAPDFRGIITTDDKVKELATKIIKELGGVEADSILDVDNTMFFRFSIADNNVWMSIKK